MEQRTCPVCGQSYLADPVRLKHGRQTTCSRQCSYTLRAQTITKATTTPCAMCGAPVTRTPSELAQARHGLNFCSSECHYAARSAGILKMPTRGPYKLGNKPDKATPKNSITNFQMDDGFGHWIAGMADGDGSFVITTIARKQIQCSFSIRLRDDDLAILELACKTTGLGHIYRNSAYGTSNPMAAWTINSKSECLSLISFFDQYFLRAKKRRDYEIWKKTVILLTSAHNPETWETIRKLKRQLDEIRCYTPQLQINSPITEDNGFGYWLSGFIDAEGCFRVHKVRKGTYYGCTFSLKLRDDDGTILQAIQKQTKIGSLKLDTFRTGNSKPCMVWSVSSMGDCQRLVQFLDQFPLRAKKSKDYAIWKEAVTCWANNGGGIRSECWGRMAELKKGIEDAREYRSPTNQVPTSTLPCPDSTIPQFWDL